MGSGQFGGLRGEPLETFAGLQKKGSSYVPQDTHCGPYCMMTPQIVKAPVWGLPFCVEICYLKS